MYKVIVFTHGELGKGLLNSARMVSGPVDDVDSFSILPGIDTDEVLATVSNKRLEKAVDVRVNLIGVDKLRVKAGRISDDNNFEFGYNGGYLYNLYLTPITQK